MNGLGVLTIEAIQDAVRCHFDEGERPAMVRLHVVREEVVPV